MASSLTSLASMESLARSPMGARLDSGTLNSTSASMGGGISRAPSAPSGGVSRKASAGTPSGIQRIASTESNSMVHRAMHSNDDDEMHQIIHEFEGYGVQVRDAISFPAADAVFHCPLCSLSAHLTWPLKARGSGRIGCTRTSFKNAEVKVERSGEGISALFRPPKFDGLILHLLLLLILMLADAMQVQLGTESLDPKS